MTMIASLLLFIISLQLVTGFLLPIAPAIRPSTRLFYTNETQTTEFVSKPASLDALASIPRRGYLQGPTPIEAMPNLSKILSSKVNLFVKRDDLLPGVAGGSKTRKLDFSFADAQGCDTVITCGAPQSNHCRLTAGWAIKEGMDCHLVLEERVPNSYSENASGNNFLFQLLGVKSTRVVPGGSDMMAEMEKTAEELRKQGKKPYIIPGGASNAIGALGYAACAEELMQQLDSMSLKMDYIIVPSGSAGTHAGMVAGMAGIRGNDDTPIIYGINTSRGKQEQEEKVYELAAETAKLLGMDDLPRDDVCCFGDYVGPGYSLATDGMVEAVKLFAGQEAILLDPVYSGKCAAGLIDLIRTNAFPEGSNVLFLHTGGSPALFEYMESFRE